MYGSEGAQAMERRREERDYGSPVPRRGAHIDGSKSFTMLQSSVET